MDLSLINTGLQTVIRLINNFRNNFQNYYNDRSVSEAVKLLRVEPLMVVSRDCQQLEIMPDVAQTILSMFCGYYLQAFDMMMKVRDVEVLRTLDRLNPDRDSTALMLSTEQMRTTMSMETYTYALPGTARLAGEEINNRENIKMLNEMSSLSVGRVINVTMDYTKDNGEMEDSEDKCVSLPITVRLIASGLNNSSILSILAEKTEDHSLTERYYAWRAGRLAFIRDLIFCQDMIDEHKKAAMKDETGTIQEIARRVTNAKTFGLLTKNPSMVSASNIFVITEENARELEARMGGKLSNSKVIQRVFDNTYAMIVAVIDRGADRVVFHIRGINTPCDVSFREVKASSKKGSDVADIVRSLTMGQVPSF